LGVQNIDNADVATTLASKMILNRQQPEIGSNKDDGSSVSSPSCVGVLIPVYDSELSALDKRETGYERVLIDDHTRIERIDELLSDEGSSDLHYRDTFLGNCPKECLTAAADKVWVYIPETCHPPSREYPIVQSYVDICMRGCLSISSKFLYEFLSSTYGWHPQEIVELMKTTTPPKKNSGDYNSDRDGGSKGTSTVVGEEADVVMGAWSNDRHAPIYHRADEKYSLENAFRLDKYLEEASLPVDSVRA
jgi:hypothetical protein